MASILVADDEAGIRQVLKWRLGELGHQVTLAADGAEAIAHIRKTEFDLIISDVRMPGATGLEVLAAVKAQWPDTEVLIDTAFAQLDVAIECVRGGAFALLQKPLEMAELFAAIALACERRELRAAGALYRASQAILVTQDFQQLPRVIAEVTMKAMAADDVSLMLAGEDETLYIAAAAGVSPQVRAKMSAVRTPVADRIAQSRAPALIQNDLAQDPRFVGMQSFHRVRSSIVYPLLLGERLVGILNINRVSDERSFCKEDLGRVAVLVSQILLALENQRLMQTIAISERLATAGKLAAGVTHEINTPLACVLANHSFLRQQLEAMGTAFSPEMQEALADAETGATQIRDIVRDMRLLARNEEELCVRVDLNEVIRSALRLAGAELCHAVAIESELGADTQVDGHAGRLAQVFVNLLVNAAQAIGEHPGRRGRVIVRTRRLGDTVVAEVTDNGPGIPPEHLPRLFEPFFTTKGATTGTGLGLSISRDIVRRYHGELRVDSRGGEGATFTIVFPAATALAVAACQADGLPESPARDAAPARGSRSL